MKALRWCFWALAGFCLASGLINGIREYYIILFVMLGMAGISAVLNLWTVLAFSYTQRCEVKRAVKGERVALHLAIFNDKPFPFAAMRVHVRAVSPADDADIVLSLPPGRSAEWDLSLPAPYRGFFSVGMSVVEITDVFGILPMRFDMRRLSYYRSPELLVYPRLVALPPVSAPRSDEKLTGDMGLAAAHSGESFSSARRYIPGDPEKRIHWKQSLRQRKLYTRQYDRPADTSLIIFMDTRTLPAGEDGLKLADLVCECACAVAYQHISAGRHVTLRAARGSITGQSLHDFERMYDWLARLPFDAAADSFAPAVADGLEKRRGAGAVIIAAGLDELLSTALRTRGGEGVIFLLAGADELPPGGVAGCSSSASLPLGCDIARELEALPWK